MGEEEGPTLSTALRSRWKFSGAEPSLATTMLCSGASGCRGHKRYGTKTCERRAGAWMGSDERMG